MPNPPVPKSSAIASKGSSNFKSLRSHSWLGAAAIVVLIGGMGGWAMTTQIAGAVVAGGLVVVDGGSKKVQHQEGGIVAEIFARNEDQVETGQLLIRLDGTTIRANLEVVVSQLREAFARQSRLLAESTGAESMVPPPLAESWPADPQLDTLYKQQDALRVSRAAGIKGQVARLDEQVAQLELQIEGLESQKLAIGEQLGILEAEGKDIEDLYKQNLVQLSRVNSVKLDISKLKGENGRLLSEIAGARAAIAERGVLSAQVNDEFQSEVLTDLQTVGAQIAEFMQQKIAAEDRLARLEIRAPISGQIHQSIVETVGGVVGSGETLMLIVPREDRLIVDTRVSPLDIDKLYVDQDVILRMSSLDARTTPELKAKIRSISPDLTQDRMTGAQYYVVRVDVPDDELAKLPAGTKLVPGMPAEAFVQTGERTVMSYMLHPLTEQLNRVFRED